MTYLQTFDRLDEISKDLKTHEYRQYLVEHLYPYLFDFFKRCKPLFNIERDLQHVNHEFELKWEQGIFPGWPVSFDTNRDKCRFSLRFDLFSCLERSRWRLGEKWRSTRSDRIFIGRSKKTKDLTRRLTLFS